VALTSEYLRVDIDNPRTGVTGLIGGDFLHILTKKYPSWSIAALVRDSQKAALIAIHYPQVEVVFGTLDDAELLERESARADVVLSTFVQPFLSG
jgi:uncharacterized protein YbjT (DUF2867 family)